MLILGNPIPVRRASESRSATPSFIVKIISDCFHGEGSILEPSQTHLTQSHPRCLGNLEAACAILEEQYEACEVVKLDTVALKTDKTLSDMAKQEPLMLQPVPSPNHSKSKVFQSILAIEH